MALADFTAFRAMVLHPSDPAVWYYRSSTTGPRDAGYGSGWYTAPWNLTIPTTSVAAPKNIVGTMRTIANGDRVIARASSWSNGNTDQYRTPVLMLIDRLNQSGGMSANITTLQTTGLPTLALTRYTSGIGVYAAIMSNVAFGATDSVATVIYTNSDGTGSRTGTVPFVASPTVRGFYPVCMQAGDVGVKSVESVQLSVATAAVGDMGIVMFKPLAFLGTDIRGHNIDATQIPGWNTVIDSAACIEPISIENSQDQHVIVELSAF